MYKYRTNIRDSPSKRTLNGRRCNELSHRVLVSFDSRFSAHAKYNSHVRQTRNVIRASKRSLETSPSTSRPARIAARNGNLDQVYKLAIPTGLFKHRINPPDPRGSIPSLAPGAVSYLQRSTYGRRRRREARGR